MNDGDEFVGGIFLDEMVCTLDHDVIKALSAWNISLKFEVCSRFEGDRIGRAEHGEKWFRPCGEIFPDLDALRNTR
ncbi:MAG: hypothetical protein ACOVK5_05805, partial [Ilumatobacteraceae bacterium]